MISSECSCTPLSEGVNTESDETDDWILAECTAHCCVKVTVCGLQQSVSVHLQTDASGFADLRYTRGLTATQWSASWLEPFFASLSLLT